MTLAAESVRDVSGIAAEGRVTLGESGRRARERPVVKLTVVFGMLPS